MKKLLFGLSFLMMLVVLVACSITSIIRIEFAEPPKDEYVVGENGGRVKAKINIYYSNNTEALSIDLENAGGYGIKVTGDTFSDPGTYVLKVSYGSITASYEYKVVEQQTVITTNVFYVGENYPKDISQGNKYADIASAISAVSDKDANNVIKLVPTITNGNYTVTNFTVTAINTDKNITIEGYKEGDIYYTVINNKLTINGLGDKFTLESIKFLGNDNCSTDAITTPDGTPLTTKEIIVNNCEFEKFNKGICIYANKTSGSRGSTDIEKLRVTNSTFKRISTKAIYVESANYTYIANNEFVENLSYPSGGGLAAATATVVDINLKFKVFEKVEIVNNTFSETYIPDAELTAKSYFSCIAVKARCDGSTYSAPTATLKLAVITNNTFNENFEMLFGSAVTANNLTKFGVSLIKIGEDDLGTDGILQYSITNNVAVNDFNKAIYSNSTTGEEYLMPVIVYGVKSSVADAKNKNYFSSITNRPSQSQ